MKIQLDGEIIDLDPANLEVDESVLNEFLKQFSSKYSYFNALHAKAQYLLGLAEDRLDAQAGVVFKTHKTNEGGSDNLVKSKVDCDDAVMMAKRDLREAKYKSQLIYGYLRSLEKSFDVCLNLCYNVRKEISKIFPQHVKYTEDIDQKIAKMLSED